jgi:hypothetical protein
MGKIWSEGSRVRAVMVGGSQIGRMAEEMGQKGKTQWRWRGGSRSMAG